MAQLVLLAMAMGSILRAKQLLAIRAKMDQCRFLIIPDVVVVSLANMQGLVIASALIAKMEVIVVVVAKPRAHRAPPASMATSRGQSILAIIA